MRGANLFSFGAVLYEMATGALPFHGESSGVILKAILDSVPPRCFVSTGTFRPSSKTSSIRRWRKIGTCATRMQPNMRTDFATAEAGYRNGRFAAASGSLPAAGSTEALESSSTGRPGAAIPAQSSRPVPNGISSSGNGRRFGRLRGRCSTVQAGQSLCGF